MPFGCPGPSAVCESGAQSGRLHRWVAAKSMFGLVFPIVLSEFLVFLAVPYLVCDNPTKLNESDATDTS